MVLAGNLETESVLLKSKYENNGKKADVYDTYAEEKKETDSEFLASQYDKKAAGYDTFRAKLPGWDRIASLLEPIDIPNKKILDLGCGTGSLFAPLLEMGATSIDGYDPSAAMIDKARAKVGEMDGAQDVISVTVGDGSDLASGSYDLIFCAQVVQNLTTTPEVNGPECRLCILKEIHRLLAPGGMCVVTTRYRKQPGDESPDEDQFSDSEFKRGTYADLYWYADPSLAPNAVRFMEHAVPADPKGELEMAGFQDCQLLNSLDTMIRRDAYYQGNLVSDANFRAADSFFSRVDENELKTILANIDELQQRGELEDYIRRRDALKGDKLGQVAILSGHKSAEL